MSEEPHVYAEFTHFKPLKKDSIQIVLEVDKSFEHLVRELFPSCQGDGSHFKITPDDR